jgi:putative Holliday junction resolvase
MPGDAPDEAPCVLALDLGTKRIGLAVSDRERRIAFPAGVLERRGGRKDLEALRALIAEREVGRVVVGLPVHMSGRRGPEAEAAVAFARSLADATGLPVETLDERWTTVEAERALRAMGRPKAKQKGLVDTVAASILLRTWLERAAGQAAAAAREAAAGPQDR